jgi:hypothetical protein
LTDPLDALVIHFQIGPASTRTGKTASELTF